MQENFEIETKNEQIAPVANLNIPDNKSKPKKSFFDKTDGFTILVIAVLSVISAIVYTKLKYDQSFYANPYSEGDFGVGILVIPFIAVFMFIAHEVSYIISKLIPWRFKHFLYPVFLFVLLLIVYAQTGADTPQYNNVLKDPRMLALAAFALVVLSSCIVLLFNIILLAKNESKSLTPSIKDGGMSKKSFFPFVLILLLATYFSPLSQKMIQLQKKEVASEKQTELNAINVEVLKNKLPSECSLGAISGVATRYTSINCDLGNTTSDTGQIWPLSWKGTVEAGELLSDSKVGTSSYIPNYKGGPFTDVALSDIVTAKMSSSSYPEGGLASIDLYWMDHDHRFSLGGQFQTTEGLNFKTDTVGNYNLTDYTKKIATIILNGVTYSN